MPATNEPAGAGVQATLPVLLLKLPAAHCVAEVAPVEPTNEPAGAGVQLALPTLALNVPAAQAVAEDAPAALNEPAGVAIQAAALVDPVFGL